MEERNAVIKSAMIDDADRGLLTAWLHLDYGHSGQAFGGYSLYLPKAYKHHNATGPNYAGHFIWRCMEIAGVSRWSDMANKTIRVRATTNSVEAIGHIVNDDWFCPKDDFAAMREQNETKT